MKPGFVIGSTLVVLSTQRVLKSNGTHLLAEPKLFSFSKFFSLPSLNSVVKHKLVAPKAVTTALGKAKPKTKTITKTHTTTNVVRSVRTKYVTQNFLGERETEYATITETSYVPIYTTRVETQTEKIPVIRYVTNDHTVTDYITAMLYGATSTATIFSTTAIPKIMLHPQAGQTETWTTTEQAYTTRIVTADKIVPYPVTMTIWQPITERRDASTVIQRITEQRDFTNYAIATVTKTEQVEVPVAQNITVSVPVQYFDTITETFTETPVPQYIRVRVTERISVTVTETIPYYLNYTVTQQVGVPVTTMQAIPYYVNHTVTQQIPVYVTVTLAQPVPVYSTFTERGYITNYFVVTSTVTTTETQSIPFITITRNNYARTSAVDSEEEATETEGPVTATSTDESLMTSQTAEPTATSEDVLVNTQSPTTDNGDADQETLTETEQHLGDYSSFLEPHGRAHTVPMDDVPEDYPIRPSPWHANRDMDELSLLEFQEYPEIQNEQSIYQNTRNLWPAHIELMGNIPEGYPVRPSLLKDYHNGNDQEHPDGVEGLAQDFERLPAERDPTSTNSPVMLFEVPLDVEEIVVRTTSTSTVTNTVTSTVERPTAAQVTQ
jgi:hypothetical protein